MKKFCLLAVPLLLASSVLGYTLRKSYDIEQIYSVQEVKSGTLGLTKMGKSVELDKILVPAKVSPGKYLVYVKRVDSNLYEIIGKDLYVKTRFCYEFAYREKAIMEIVSSFGNFSIGKIYFDI